MIKMITFYYFSPTGGTKRAGDIFCDGISEDVKSVNLGLREQTPERPEGELTVIAAPVFGGRIPSVVAERLKELDGSGKKAVTIVVYGNRAYEDALLELNHAAENSGFQITASAALVAQHSMAPEIAEGRPDAEDKKSILAFAEKVLDKIESGGDHPVKVPGNYPYKDAMSMPVSPVSLPSCNQCKTCISVCPTEAVCLNDDKIVTDTDKCILCMACVAACPSQARILPPPLKEKMEQMLGALKSVHSENEYFL